MKNAKTKLLAAAMAALAVCAPAAETAETEADPFVAAIEQDRGRAAGLFHRYEFREIRDTPPPDGYVPFYVAHYGRHGSRYQIDKKSFRAVETLRAAKEAGVLTDAGSDLLARLEPIVAEHDGMWGQLSLLGAEEHRRLAARMHERFPAVFAGGGKVRCQASTIQRCLASMANFACTLKGLEPALDFSFATGDRYMATILHPYLHSDERGKWLARFDREIVEKNVDPARLVGAFFRDSPETARLVPEPHRFAFDLFAAANSFETLGVELGGASIDDVFAFPELTGLARARSCIHYAHMANAEEYGWCAAESARPLAAEIAASASDAIARGDVRADLRFGHDSGLRPLAGLLGLEGAGARSPAADSWRTSPTWRDMPMASNLQIVLYRRPAGGGDGPEILAKVLYNEAETAVSGLVPHSGPYYDWNDLRARLENPPPSGDGAPEPAAAR
ncbi:MAG: hypothetical protein IJ678_08510 [Kiritimatiellae bacterium]|nr:hypothetical protein [Kiritimatiellia bacterium]